MTVQLENNCPVLASNQIVGRVRLAELKGWFTKDLRVSEGTCALIFDGGHSNGVLPPGEYTLQSFLGGLFTDMDKRNISAVICRTNDLPLHLVCGNILTRENLLANIEMNISVHFTDLPLFTLNLLGSQDDMTLEQLAEVIQPILLQSIRESVAQLSITEITLPQNKNLILAALQQATKISLSRYGFDIVSIMFLSVSNEQYNQLQQKVGENFLLKEGIEIDADRGKIEEIVKRREIEAEERENDLLVLAAHVAGDRKDAEILEEERRIKQRQRLRDSLQSEEFTKIDSKAKMEAFLHVQDKQNLLRKEEIDILVETYENEKENREIAREHLVRKINLENAADLAKLQAVIVQAQQLQALQYESELIQKTTANLALSNVQELQQAEHTERLRTIQRSTESVEVQHKITLRRIEEDNAAKRQREQAEFDIWKKKEEQKLRQEELEGKSKLALDNIKTMAELDALRKKQKFEHESAMKSLDNDSEKQKLLAQKEANEKLELERQKIEAEKQRLNDAVAAASAKNASDIKDIAMVLAGAKNISNTTEEKPKEMVVIVCPKCKTRNNGEAKFCGSCGEML